LLNPDFAKYVKIYKMRVSLLAIRNQIRAEGKFNPDDMLPFADKDDIYELKKVGDYKGTQF
jgi:hypothetical protein